MDAARTDAEDFAEMRVGYSGGPGAQRLDVSDLQGGWIPLFSRWLVEAQAAGIREPNAMVLSTVGADGRPSSRTVLCKGVGGSSLEGADEAVSGLQFFTSRNSRKGQQIAETGVACATFFWVDIERQIHLEGSCHPIGALESSEYWSTRPRGSQIAAWASHQSEAVASLAELDALLAAATTRFAQVEEIPMPPQWGGYLLIPDRVEFWRGGRDRFHDRIVTQRTGVTWAVDRLQP